MTDRNGALLEVLFPHPTAPKGRGGPRPGAGRPARGALPRVTGTVPAGIPARLAAVLDAGESTSQLVGSAVVAEVERREKER